MKKIAGEIMSQITNIQDRIETDDPRLITLDKMTIVERLEESMNNLAAELVRMRELERTALDTPSRVVAQQMICRVNGYRSGYLEAIGELLGPEQLLLADLALQIKVRQLEDNAD